MNPIRKYRNVLGENPVRNAVLRSFYAVATDNVTRMTFKMATDEQARGVLDDEDFELWSSKKAEYLASATD